MNCRKFHSNFVAAIESVPRFIHSKTAATRPPLIERALKFDVLTILVAYQEQYLFNVSTNVLSPISIQMRNFVKK